MWSFPAPHGAILERDPSNGILLEEPECGNLAQNSVNFLHTPFQGWGKLLLSTGTGTDETSKRTGTGTKVGSKLWQRWSDYSPLAQLSILPAA